MTEQERGPSTMSNLDELERLLEAATPGPWEWVEPHSIVHHPQEPEVSHAVWNIAAVEGLFSIRHKNGQLIVAAVNSLPALIAAARRAEALDRLEAALEQVERDGLIVLLGVGNPEERTDFTDAPAEVAAAVRATLTEEGAPR